jgi:hypothetical protein
MNQPLEQINFDTILGVKRRKQAAPTPRKWAVGFTLSPPEHFQSEKALATAATFGGKLIADVIFEMLFADNGPAVPAPENHQAADVRPLEAEGLVRVVLPVVGIGPAVQALYLGIEGILEVPVPFKFFPLIERFGLFGGFKSFKGGLDMRFQAAAAAAPEFRAEHDGVEIAILVVQG